MFIIGTMINIIATRGYTETVRAKGENIVKLRVNEGDLNISVSIFNNILTNKEIGKQSKKS